MSSEEIKAVRFICLGCGKRIIVEQGEKPEGFHGLMEWLTPKTEQRGQVYACRRACVQKAVLTAVGYDGVSTGRDDEVNSAGMNIPESGPAV